MILSEFVQELKDYEDEVIELSARNLSYCKGRIFHKMDEIIYKEIQLHEGIEFVYVVDGYLARYTPDDGNTYPIEVHNESPMLALAELCVKIDGQRKERGK